MYSYLAEKRKVKMNLYIKFDARETGHSKLGYLMVLDTRKCLKLDARTRSMLEEKELEVSLPRCGSNPGCEMCYRPRGRIQIELW